MTDNREALILALAEAGVHPLGRHDVADRLIAAGVTLRSEPTLDEGLREALRHIRGIASGEGGDDASRSDPYNALTTIVIVCDESVALAAQERETP